ncbi:MAG: hypothetical protein JXA90_14570 [Planctomycetes bacterium]|nr:hypothetical protein [Planctomycetota bacterium]
MAAPCIPQATASPVSGYRGLFTQGWLLFVSSSRFHPLEPQDPVLGRGQAGQLVVIRRQEGHFL